MSHAVWTLKSGKEKKLRQGHPWVFSGAIKGKRESADPSDEVQVVSHEGQILGRGLASPQSTIAARIFRWDEGPLDEAFFRQRLRAAIAMRAHVAKVEKTNAFRLVFSEADGLPGLVVDQYDDMLVLAAQTEPMDRRKEMVARLLMEETTARGVYERSDAEVRKKEGLSASTGLLAGELTTDLTINEAGRRYGVDVGGGQKTGFFVDHRSARNQVAANAQGRSVLDVFSFTGGFSVAAAQGGASQIKAVDISERALEQLDHNLRLNDVDPQGVEKIRGDAFKVLRALGEAQEKHDLVVLDPPKLAPHRAAVKKALRAYKDLNLQGLKLLAKGGLLFTFSCSGNVDRASFEESVRWAAMDAPGDFQVIQTLTQASCHPWKPSFPEALYLKGLCLRRMD